MSDFLGQPPTPAEGSPIPVDPLLNSLSVEEAAGHLGVSGQTIRRRLKRGELRGELVLTATGKEWRIYRDALPVVSPPTVETVEQVLPTGSSPAVAEAILNTLQQVAINQARQADALERIAAAMERQGQQQGQQHAQQALPVPRRPWWRVWGR